MVANGNGQAPAVVSARDGSKEPKDIKALLSSKKTKERLSAIAAKHMDAERLMRISALAIHETPNLIKCNPMSLLGVIFECAQLGMEPNTALQHCHLVPYKKKKKVGKQWVEEYDVELIIGYRGYIDLARRSGLTSTIHADVVHASDEFDYFYGSEQFLRHKPRLFDLDERGNKIPLEDRGNSIGYYAYCKLVGGEAFNVMAKSDIIKIRDESQGFQAALASKKSAEKSGYGVPKAWSKCPWVKYFDAMGRKSPIRALASELPLSVEFHNAIKVDGAQMNYDELAPASDGEIVDLDPSHWQHDDGEEEEPEVQGQPAGDEGPARIEQGADQTINVNPVKQPETVDRGTGEITNPPKAAAPRKTTATGGLFQE